MSRIWMGVRVVKAAAGMKTKVPFWMISKRERERNMFLESMKMKTKAMTRIEIL